MCEAYGECVCVCACVDVGVGVCVTVFRILECICRYSYVIYREVKEKKEIVKVS